MNIEFRYHLLETINWFLWKVWVVIYFGWPVEPVDGDWKTGHVWTICHYQFYLSVTNLRYVSTLQTGYLKVGSLSQTSFISAVKIISQVWVQDLMLVSVQVWYERGFKHSLYLIVFLGHVVTPGLRINIETTKAPTSSMQWILKMVLVQPASLYRLLHALILPYFKN